MTEIQIRLVKILKWFNEFCISHHLKYYILGGTMLGAVRHGGFIPWDDDIDVGLPRKDYEEFLTLTKGAQFGDFVTEGIDTPNKDFFYGYAKIYDTKSTLVENNRYKIKRGIYVDVFPIDGVANSSEEINSYISPIFSKHNLLLARSCGIRKGRKWYKNASVRLARLIPNFIIDNKKLMLSVDNMCKQRDYDDYSIVGNLYGAWGRKEIMEKNIFGNPTLYNFEDIRVYGVEDYDRYLTSLYGDWRKLPPKEKQVTHHDFLECDLRKSYLNDLDD